MAEKIRSDEELIEIIETTLKNPFKDLVEVYKKLFIALDKMEKKLSPEERRYINKGKLFRKPLLKKYGEKLLEDFALKAQEGFDNDS